MLAGGMVALCSEMDHPECQRIREMYDRMSRMVLWDELNHLEEEELDKEK